MKHSESSTPESLQMEPEWPSGESFFRRRVAVRALHSLPVCRKARLGPLPGAKDLVWGFSSVLAVRTCAKDGLSELFLPVK